MKQRTIEEHEAKITEAKELIKEITAEGDPNGRIPSIKKKINKRRAEIRRLTEKTAPRNKFGETKKEHTKRINRQGFCLHGDIWISAEDEKKYQPIY